MVVLDKLFCVYPIDILCIYIATEISESSLKKYILKTGC